MIISRTPFRISFFGGGTDYPGWYREHGGMVISTSVDKYCYVTCRFLPPFFKFKHRIRYYVKEEVNTIDQIKHPSVRECLRFMKIRDGVEIVHNADLPARSGLGSSSTFTVGLLHALHTLKNQMPTKRDLALQAIHVEQDMIKENVGSQDQVIAAFGGFNKIIFGGVQEITVAPIVIDPGKLKILQESLMLFFTGFPRNAHEVAAAQIKNINEKKLDLGKMKEIVDEALSILISPRDNLDDFGRLLHEQWQIKRTLTGLITNSHIDNIYETALRAGSSGGKLLGAGGGGFILFYVKPQLQQRVKKALKQLLHIPFYFEHLGSQIVYYTK